MKSSIFCLFTRGKIQIAECGKEMIVLLFGTSLVRHQVTVQDNGDRESLAVYPLQNHQHYNSGSPFHLGHVNNPACLWLSQ